jgi:hypothetical protein
MLKRLLDWRQKPAKLASAVGSNGSEWLDGYTGQTTDDLIRLAESHRVDSVVLAFEQALPRRL